MDTIGTRSITDVHFLGASTNLCENDEQGESNDIAHSNSTNNAAYVNRVFECDSANDQQGSLAGMKSYYTWNDSEDTLVYANLSEIARLKELEEIDRRPNPPYPDATAQPIRIITNGWREYRTLGGRSYYFHPNSGHCQWKPPRTTGGRARYFDGNSTETVHGSCPASTSTGHTEFFAEIPLHRELCKFPKSDIDEANNFYRSTIETIEAPNKEVPIPGMSHSLDAEMGTDNKYGMAAAEAKHRENMDSFYDTPANSKQGTAIRHGFLEKCKLAENGIKLKRKDWCSAYAYLYIGHLLFYKDQKSAEKTGRHYPAPIDVCDLRNAMVSLSCTDNEKQRDKRRKHLISLVLLSKTEYQFSCTEEEDKNAWFQALRQAITSTPVTKTPSNTIISDYNGSLQRSLRHKRDFSGTFSGGKSLHNSIKSRLKPSSTSKTISEDHFSITTENSTVESSPPAKATIIERLLRFFRSRPSMESLRERGIYKPEPVFGSTLAEICAREKSSVPKFIIEVTSLIEQKGIDLDGLYRVNGNLSSVQKIRCQIDQDCYDVMRREEDIHVLSGALKLFLRELQEPIFPVSTHKDFMSAMRESGSKRVRCIDDLLLRLPPINRETIRILLTHLNRVATHSGKNRMQIHNLAIIFGPSLFCSEERSGQHMRKPSQDKGKTGGNKRKSLEKRAQEEANTSQPTVPTQNLAYRMIVYGQILEFILTESERLTIFRSPIESDHHRFE